KDEPLSVEVTPKVEKTEKVEKSEKPKKLKKVEKPDVLETTGVDDEQIVTQYQKLTGPKIAGEKIDLSQFEKPKKKKEDKKAAAGDANKKKRRRISKGPATPG